MFYIFDRKTNKIRTTDDVKEWGLYFNDINNRRIGYDEVGNFIVSTVFLGVDHNFMGTEPLLFESMIFDKRQPTRYLEGSYKDVYTERYSSYEQADAKHRFMVEKLEGALGLEDNLEIEFRSTMMLGIDE